MVMIIESIRTKIIIFSLFLTFIIITGCISTSNKVICNTHIYVGMLDKAEEHMIYFANESGYDGMIFSDGSIHWFGSRYTNQFVRSVGISDFDCSILNDYVEQEIKIYISICSDGSGGFEKIILENGKIIR